MSTTLLWFGNDLRLHDNAALRAAADIDQPLICLFCVNEGWFKTGQFGTHPISKNHTRLFA